MYFKKCLVCKEKHVILYFYRQNSFVPFLTNRRVLIGSIHIFQEYNIFCIMFNFNASSSLKTDEFDLYLYHCVFTNL